MANHKRSKKRKKKPNYTRTDHHIIPSSRGGNSKLENIAKVPDRDHRFYHALFENKTPEEIIPYLVENFWNGKWEYVQRAYDSEKDYL